MFSFRGEKEGEEMEDDSIIRRENIYTMIIMEQETDERWQSFLISRAHDELLLMSGRRIQ
jgi:hypothetical protein